MHERMAEVPGTGPRGDDRLLVPYWLRAVRIGLVATVIVLATLLVLPALPHDFPIDPVAYALVLVGGTGGALIVWRLPWRRLFENGPWGVRLLYTWSMADIVLVSVGLATTGGGGSPLFFVYALTTVFFGAAYPPRGQGYLLLFTIGAYLAAMGFAGWETSLATVVLHLSVLGTLTLLTSFMFRELLARMRAQEERFEEEHRMVERLAELDRLKSDFLTTVSHELRTPVTVIQGVGSTLERVWETLDRETIESMLRGLSQNARSLDEAITTLLDFSRMDAGAAAATMLPVDIEALVRATARRVEEGSSGRPIDLDLRRGLRVSADPSLVDRILEHLLNNALQHTDPDVPVRVETRVDAADVLIVVADRGPGISPDELPHLTERFFRGGDINTRPRGLGLGLSLVSEMAALMGTTIEIDSAPGWGSRFAFRLALLEDMAAGPASRAAHLTTEPAQLRTEPARLRTKPVELRTEPAHLRTEPAELRTEPAPLRTEPARTAHGPSTPASGGSTSAG